MMKEVNECVTAQFNLAREAAMSKDVAKYDEVLNTYWVEGWQLVRPSGNPVTADNYKERLKSSDVKFFTAELVSIDSTKIFANGAAAVVVYTAHEKFEHQGTAHDDIAVFFAAKSFGRIMNFNP